MSTFPFCRHLCMMRSIIIFMFAILLLTACAKHSNHLMEPSFSISSDVVQGIGEKQTEHDDYASEYQDVLEAFGGTYYLPGLQDGVERLISRLVKFSDYPDLRYELTILDSPLVDAFLLPEGHIYITRGLLAIINDEDELAAVLAHEISHDLAQHTVRSHVAIDSNVFRPISSLDETGYEKQNRLLKYFSHQQELIADQIGMKIAIRAGFDPFAAVSFLQSIIRDIEYQNRRFNWRNRHDVILGHTHPSPLARIDSIWKMANDLGFRPEQMPRYRASYMRLIDGMIYGDSPQDGYVRGRKFLHPEFNIEFSVPVGFSLYNARDAVFIIGPDDTVIRFDGMKQDEYHQELEDYMRYVWGWEHSITVQPVESMSNGDFSIVYGLAERNGWKYQLAIVRANESYVFRFLLAHNNVTIKPDETLRSIVTSLRRRDDTRIDPLRIRIVTVQPNDTVRSLSVHLMHWSHDPEDHFRLINGLTSEEDIQAGQIIKMIVEQ